MLKLSSVFSKNLICRNTGAFSAITQHNHRLHIGETNVIGNVADVNSKEYQVITYKLNFYIFPRSIYLE